MRALLLLMCLFTLSTSFTQSRFSFGIDLEAGISGKKDNDRNDHISFEEGVLSSYENGRLTGPAFSAGLWADFQVFSFLSIRSGVAYRGLQMGWYSWYDDRRPASPSANDYRYDSQLQAQYLEMPTSLRLQLPLKNSPTVRPFVEWGLRPGWFVGGQYTSTQQTAESKGKDTHVYSLTPQQHHKPFGAPMFWGVGLELNRITIGMTFHRERTFYYGSPNYFMFCGVGESPYYYHDADEPFIHGKEWQRSLTAKISYRLF